MKKVILMLVAVATMVGCSKESATNNETKNYPDSIEGTIWTSKVFASEIGNMAATIEFIGNRKATCKLHMEGAGTFVASDYYLYSYQLGKGSVIPGSQLTKVTLRDQEGETTIVYQGGSYYKQGANGQNELHPLQDFMREWFRLMSDLGGDFTVQGDKLTIDGIEFIRQ